MAPPIPRRFVSSCRASPSISWRRRDTWKADKAPGLRAVLMRVTAYVTGTREVYADNASTCVNTAVMILWHDARDDADTSVLGDPHHLISLRFARIVSFLRSHPLDISQVIMQSITIQRIQGFERFS